MVRTLLMKFLKRNFSIEEDERGDIVDTQTDGSITEKSLTTDHTPEITTQYFHARYVTTYISQLTSLHLCRLIIEKGEINHNVKLGLFTVLGTTGNAHAVRLFPKESCTCPVSSLCYHIIAAKLSIGMEVVCGGKSSKVNLTVLRQNTKAKKDKMSGRKKP